MWYPKSILIEFGDNKKKTRCIEGVCENCGLAHRMKWGHFVSRGYRFRHLKCAQAEWNSEQKEAANKTHPIRIGERIARKYQHGAKARGYIYRLHIMEVTHLVFSNCFYCGREPSSYRGKFKYTGIDRLDNSKGYFLENCVSCCSICNFLKRDMPYEKWADFLNRIVLNWGRYGK